MWATGFVASHGWSYILHMVSGIISQLGCEMV